MMLLLKKTVQRRETEHLIRRLALMGLAVYPEEKRGQSALVLLNGTDKELPLGDLVHLPFVEKVLSNTKSSSARLPAIGRTSKTGIEIKGLQIGGNTLTIMAGPCAVESEKQINQTARRVKSAGARILRGGAFKPRTSPYDFQGLGEKGLRLLAQAGHTYGLVTISEVLEVDQLETAAEYLDILQVGARNMQNFALLKEVGRLKKPVLLKRGWSATYRELLLAAEYILNAGNRKVLLCERGIRTFETFTRNTLDLAAVPVLHELSRLPVFVDPSHGTGLRHLVIPLARAAVAAGADGLMVEVHPQPDKALSDGPQSLTFTQFDELMKSLRLIAPAVGKELP